MKMKNKLLLLAMGIMLSAQTLMAQVPSYVPTDGLVAYWPFSGNANDVTTNGNNGSVNGAALAVDRFGNANSAYSFNGSNSYISVPHNASFNMQKATWSVWVKSDVATTGNGRFIMGKRDNASHFVSFYERNGNGGEEIGWAPNLANGTLGYNIVNTWHLLTITYDLTISTNNHSFYFDGVLVASGGWPSSFVFSNGELRFGIQDNSSYFQPFSGLIDDATVYNRILTQEEITSLYSSVQHYSDTCNNVSGSLTQGLVGYWPFCGNANDDSGNGNNGTVNGATLTTDRFGNSNSAYNFDGITNYISVSDNSSLDFTNQMSVSLWYNFDNLNFDSTNNIWQGRLIDKTQNGNSTSGYWSSLISSNNPSSQWYCNGQNYANASVNFANNGGKSICSQKSNWYNLVYTFENGFYKIFLDGVLIDFNTISIGTIPTNNFPVLFGYANGTTSQIYHYKGKLDDIGIWNRALTPTEVSQLYNQNQCFTNITVTDTLIINVGQLSYNNPVTYANNITIAPNPASTQININFNNITDLNGGSLKVINSLGQEVATTPITTSGTQSIMQLATWGGSGMYFVQIINPQGQIVDIKKIILQ